MTKIMACLDGSIYSQSVCDHAAWAAGRLDASVELLQVIGRREISAENRSGRIVPSARRQLLEELASLDEQRARLMMQNARLTLDESANALRGAGLEVTTTLRHGDLLETLAEREAEADMVVIGKRGEAADFARLHLGSNLERILRGATRPVLVASRAMKPIRRFMLAFDGRSSALKAVGALAASPLLKDAEGVLLTAGEPDAGTARAAEAAAERLGAAGLRVTAKTVTGAPKLAIPKAVKEDGIDLLVMGAYGHSLLKTLLIGSTTSEVIRNSLIPVLVYR